MAGKPALKKQSKTDYFLEGDETKIHVGVFTIQINAEKEGLSVRVFENDSDRPVENMWFNWETEASMDTFEDRMYEAEYAYAAGYPD
jgi:hypothetical protein